MMSDAGFELPPPFRFLTKTVPAAVPLLFQSSRSNPSVAEKNKVPVVASDEGSVERGAIAANTVNYEQQGKDVADMAVKIIEGAKPADLPVQVQKNFDLNVNEAAAQRMGVTIPAAVLDRAAKKF